MSPETWVASKSSTYGSNHKIQYCYYNAISRRLPMWTLFPVEASRGLVVFTLCRRDGKDHGHIHYCSIHTSAWNHNQQ